MNSFNSARAEAQQQLRQLIEKRAELEADLAEHSIRISKLESLIENLTEMIGDTPNVRSNGSTPDRTLFTDYETTLSGIPRQGYGVVTRAVASLLEAVPSGISARDLTEVLKSAGFRLNGPDEEMTVRSALKNLRTSGRAIYDSPTGRYRAPKKQPRSAVK